MAFMSSKVIKKLVDDSSASASNIVDVVPGDIDDLIDDFNPKRVFIGTDGDDSMTGTNKSDLILADPTVADDIGGNDVVFGRDGDDSIYGFGGDDIVYGGKGDDTIQTADGEDFVDAGPGKDDVQSGRGNDVVLGGLANDELRGGEGDDYLHGNEDNDRIIGGSGEDVLIDGTGQDTLEGRTRFDKIVLAPDATTDKVVIQDGDIGVGFDTVFGCDTAAPVEGGDLVDLTGIDAAVLSAVQRGEAVLILAEREFEAKPILLAEVAEVELADLLDDNVLAPAGKPVEADTDPVAVQALLAAFDQSSPTEQLVGESELAIFGPAGNVEVLVIHDQIPAG